MLPLVGHLCSADPFKSRKDVSGESADRTLLDDYLATIVAAVPEGRIIYDDIRKFIIHILIPTGNFGEIAVMLLSRLQNTSACAND